MYTTKEGEQISSEASDKKGGVWGSPPIPTKRREKDLQVLSGISTTAAKKLFRSGVRFPLTCVTKFVGAKPY